MVAARHVGDDRGSASIAVVGVLVLIVAIGVATVGATRILAERSRVSGAADAAALAAADAVAGLTVGGPCETATTVAAANEVVVMGCSIEGMTVTVRVVSRVGAVPVSASATAGPPPEPAPPSRGGL
ncbi:Rv3654c family TadE-like protein [Frigoribacterium sp. 2-23]|uniref:Rv3654c family TadE-like protein n=1 Tax=Frigoribacterium sp. 2-23 TaxID=3415006 RepID=UPI003C6F25BE